MFVNVKLLSFLQLGFGMITMSYSHELFQFQDLIGLPIVSLAHEAVGKMEHEIL